MEGVAIKQTIKKFFKRWHRIPLWAQVVIIVAVVITGIYGGIFGPSKPVSFAYTGQDCVRQLTLFPTAMKQATNSDFSVRMMDEWKLNGYPVFSTKTCFDAQNAPTPGQTTVTVSPFGSWFAAKKFSLHVAEPPVAQTTDFIDKTLPVTRPLEISLTSPDAVFDYKFKVGDKTADCDHQDSTLSCAINVLGLAQGQSYETSLARYFNDQQVEVLGQGTINTLLPITLTGATVSNGQTIYDKPTSFSFDYDKPLDTVKAELKIKTAEGLVSVDATVGFDGKKATITPVKELARNSEFQLVLQQVEATDGSALADEYVVNFSTAGGPKVVGISTHATGVPLSGTIVVTFDQDIANTNALGTLVSVSGITPSISISGKRLVINYSAEVCSDFSILVKKGFENASKIAQDADWRFSGRTLCYTVSTIGYSKQGQAINAYSFGSGSKVILYTGAMHGNEQSGRLLMNAWIGELDANARSIPLGTRIVVVPQVNPDGVAANSRYNAGGVDLNRNYDTSDWQQDVQTVNGDPLPGGGGSYPGSEPETQALMALSSQLQPTLTLSFHSSASYAIANTCGNSPGLAATYASMTGYQDMTGVSGAFSYQITGTYDDWLCERLGLASVLIELATSTNAEFSRNRAAL
ncbi:MAG: DUF2817 domain-containing protein, partial [Candidatus Microsaccharimonas sp.]